MSTAVRLQPREPDAPRLVNVLRSPKRIRTVFGGTTVADSRDVLVLRSNHFLPIYFFPREAIGADVLKATGEQGHHEPGGETEIFALETGGKRVDSAAWSIVAPSDPTFLPLAGRIAFVWKAADAWFEEDEEVFVHARDPYARIDALRSSSHVEIILDGTVIADTVQPVLLFETHLPTRFYIPQADVRLDRLAPSDTVTRCPYKGLASYWSARRPDGSLNPDIAWEYRDPIPEMPKIRNLIAFYPDRVDEIRLDGERVS